MFGPHSILRKKAISWGLPLLAFLLIGPILKAKVAAPFGMDPATWHGWIDLASPLLFWSLLMIGVFVVKMVHRQILWFAIAAQAYYLYTTLDTFSTLSGYSAFSLMIGYPPGAWVFPVTEILFIAAFFVTFASTFGMERMKVEWEQKIRARLQGNDLNLVQSKRDDEGSRRWEKFESFTKPAPDSLAKPNGPVVIGVAAKTPEEVSTGDLLRVDPIGSGHITVLAGSGGGKTVSMLSTIIDWPFSAFIYDPKGEIRAMTARWRDKMGHKIYWLDPQAKGVTHGCDVLEWLSPEDDVFIGQTDIIANSLFVEKGGDGDNGAGSFFTQMSRVLAKSGMLAVFDKWIKEGKVGPRPTIYDVAVWLSRADEELIAEIKELHAVADQVLKEATRTGDDPPFIQSALFQWLGSFATLEAETMSKIRASITAELNWTADPSLVRLVTGSSFKMSEILDQKTTIYLNFTPEDAARAGSCLRVIVGSMLGMQLRIPERNEVLYFLDETAQLGNLSVLHDTALQYARGAGIVLCSVWQSVDGAEKAAGKGIVNKWISNSSVQIFFKAQNPNDGEFVSKICGKMTMEQRSTTTGENQKNDSDSMMGSRGGENSSVTVSLKQRDLIMPDEVMNLPSWQSIVRVSGFEPIKVGRPDYFKIPKFNAMADKNPFRPENKGLVIKMPEASLAKTYSAMKAAKKKLAEAPVEEAYFSVAETTQEFGTQPVAPSGAKAAASEDVIAKDQALMADLLALGETARSWAEVNSGGASSGGLGFSGDDDIDSLGVGGLAALADQQRLDEVATSLDLAGLERDVLVHAVGRRRAVEIIDRRASYAEIFDQIGVRNQEETTG